MDEKQPSPSQSMSLELRSHPPEQQQQEVNQTEPPEGGFDAWSTVFGAWMTQFATYGYITAFGVFQDYYTRIFLDNVSPSAVSWIGSVQYFLPLIMGLYIGHLFDVGHFRSLMLFGSVLFTFSLFMLSLAQPHHYYQVFLAQGIGMGLGLGLMFTPSISITSHHFRRRRALAAGIVLSGSSVGGIVHPIMLNHLFNKQSVGFAGGVRASGYLVLGCLFLANLTMRTRLPPRKRGEREIVLAALFSDTTYVLSIIAALFVLLALYFPTFYIQLYSVDHGIALSSAFNSVALLNAGSVVGRIIPNLLADYVQPLGLIIPIAAACTGLMFSLLAIRTVASMIVVAIFYGIASGAYLSLTVAIATYLARTPAEIGLRVGVAFSGTSVAALIGTPIAGAILGHDVGIHLHWIHAMTFSAVCGGVGTLLFAAAYVVALRSKRLS